MFCVLQLQGYEQIFSGTCKLIHSSAYVKIHVVSLTAIAYVMSKSNDDCVTQIFIISSF